MSAPDPIRQRDDALQLARELTAELQRTRQALSAARAAHEIAAARWQAERDLFLRRLDSAATNICELRTEKEQPKEKLAAV